MPCTNVLEKPGFCFLIWHKGILPTILRRAWRDGYGWEGSEGIVSMAVTARGQGGAGTVLNRSHCDYGLKSEVFLKFISFYFFL